MPVQVFSQVLSETQNQRREREDAEAAAARLARARKPRQLDFRNTRLHEQVHASAACAGRTLLEARVQAYHAELGLDSLRYMHGSHTDGRVFAGRESQPQSAARRPSTRPCCRGEGDHATVRRVCVCVYVCVCVCWNAEERQHAYSSTCL